MRLLATATAALTLLATGCGSSRRAEPSPNVDHRQSDATPPPSERERDCTVPVEATPKAVLLEGFDLGADEEPARIAVSCEKRTSDFLSECQEIRLWLGARSMQPEAKLGLTASANLSVTVLEAKTPSSPFFISGARKSGAPWHLLLRPDDGDLHALWESPPDNMTWTLEPSGDTWKIQRIECNREAQPERCDALGEDYEEGDDLWTDPNATFTDETLRWNGSTVETQTKSRVAPFAECDCAT